MPPAIDSIARLDVPAALPQRAWQSVLATVAQALQERGAHAQRSVVLLPYAQLMPVARAVWQAMAVDQGKASFVPRFETTMNWATRLRLEGGLDTTASELDIRFDTACDLLTAARWLDDAGLGARRDDLAGALVEAAWQLAPLAAAQPPEARAAWGQAVRDGLLAGMESGLLKYEAAVARIALEWALASAHASDILFADDTVAGLDCLVLVRGFQPDALSQALLGRFGRKAFALDLAAVDTAHPVSIALHEASDAQDEASRAAACVLRHLNAGHAPVALAANDRSLIRRVRAELGARGVRLRDETGWKLSTTHSAAALMAVLRAVPRHASSDAVLDWAKQVPFLSANAVDSLELELRRAGVSAWPSFRAISPVAIQAAAQLNQWRTGLQAARPLTAWLAALRELLQASGQWPALAGDAAGAELLQALYLEPGRELELPVSTRRLVLSDFTHWVNAALEGASFKPLPPEQADVVILPLSQLLGRPFAAVVVPGCDEAHLPVSPDPSGAWTAAQRLALGLPQRAELQTAARAAWTYLLRSAATEAPRTDILWRNHEAGEAVLPSGFVQELLLKGHALAEDPRVLQHHTAAPQNPPQPQADALPRETLSASAYADLRACPYRYFGLRSLGLAEAEELDGTLDKRDFGNWLHLVLKIFHENLDSRQKPPEVSVNAWFLASINIAAGQATQKIGLDEAGFTPFAAAWPRVRDGYLHWLAGHTASGAQFAQAEQWQELPLGKFKLVGKIDRIDTLPGGKRMVIDYKTESPATTKKRLDDPLDDTQLAFYAALLADDELQAAYVNVGEKDGTNTYAMDDIVQLRDALIEGIRHDMDRIGAGDPLPALGEGSACDYCAARGLCRKDFWS